MKIEKGTTLGHYEIVSQIGAGGMGEVYLAEDTKLHRKLALKVLPAEVASNQERMRRFHQEAIAAAALNHPNIAHVYEIGETDGVHFIAMEFIDGVTLREKIHRDHPDLRKLLRYLEQVAKALARAHSAGIVHRDLKPENIMITRDGYAKVLDFGLAKLTEQRAHSGAGDSPGSDVVTAILPQQSTPGTVLGTAGYMSPEQAQGHTDEIDHRSDIFSFGCILFEAATGQKAFDGKDAIDSLHKIVHATAPQISEFNPGAPAELQKIVRRCLAKEADKRYQSIGDVAIELEELRQEMKAAVDLDSSVDPSAASASSTGGAQSSADSSAASVSGTTQIDSARTTSSAEYIVSQVKQHRLGAVLILMLAVLIIAGYFGYKYLNPTKQIESVAVLPFENATGDSGLDYLSDGLAAHLIDKLSQLPELRVTPRTSSFRHRGLETKEVATKLGVQAIVVGRVEKFGDSLAVRVELINAAADRQIWSQQFDRKLADVLNMTRDISAAAARQLRPHLSLQQQSELAKSGTTNQRAYDLWLKARHVWSTGFPAFVASKVVEIMEQAVLLDPGFAAGHAELSKAYLYRAFFENITSVEGLQKSEASARKALELDESLAEAHGTLGSLYFIRWDWANAEMEFRRALDLDPNSAYVHNGYSYFLCSVGRYDEAVQESKRTFELDPVTFEIVLAQILEFSGRLDEAEAEYRRLLEVNPAHHAGHWGLSAVFEFRGMYKESLTEFREMIRLDPDSMNSQWLKLILVGLTAQAGERKEARDMLVKLKNEGLKVSNFAMAMLETRMDNRDAAFAYLEKAFSDHEVEMTDIKTASGLARLRGDPRLDDIIRRMNFPQ